MATSTMLSPPMSPLVKPAMVTNNSRPKLSARRGSVSAYDPYNTFAAAMPPRSPGHTQSSKLTIVRVDPQVVPHDEPSIQTRLSGKGSGGRNHRRTGSGASTSSTSSHRERERERERVSFAFSSFSPPSPTVSHQSLRSPMLGPVRPRSPLAVSTSGHGLGGHYRSPSSGSLSSRDQSRRPLSPDQLFDLAQQSLYAATSPGPSSPIVTPSIAPAAFTPLADDMFLPFVDRPSEVRELLTSAPTSRLWMLLSQTFPKDRTEESEHPKDWSFAQLDKWLTNTDRDEAGDDLWVGKARMCIRARSELIWERLKGALGVPPELDEDIFDLAEPEEEEVFVEQVVAGTPTVENGPRMGQIFEDEDVPVNNQSEEVVRGLRFSTVPRPSVSEGSMCGSGILAGSAAHHEPYDVVAERGPGNPLFPSSFARLTLAPTLAANNPKLRTPHMPPASAYSPTGFRKHRNLPSWVDGLDTTKVSEYAMTTASGSSIAGGDLR